MEYDAIILGGGAAGLFCAAQAGQRARRVLVLERSAAVGRKILISGGGRCNFTNIGAGYENFLSDNPHFAKSALRRYTAQDFVALVEAHGIAWHEKTLGQLFCNGSARQIVAMLLDECDRADAVGGQVDILCDQDIANVAHDDGAFVVTANGRAYGGRAVVLATGGPSIPKMGASGFAYDIARQFGLRIIERRPALVPLTLGGDDVLFRDLSGVSATVRARSGAASFDEAALFTHRGLSGPSILQVSSYWRRGHAVTIDFLPDRVAGWLPDAKRTNPRATLKTVLKDALPERLAATLADRLDMPGDLGNLPDKALRAAEARLAAWSFTPNGTEGFAKAEVTAGGIDTRELSSRTMEARRVPGLYAIGEAVDVTGWLGGYNFQWAWASGWAAAQTL